MMQKQIQKQPQLRTLFHKVKKQKGHTQMKHAESGRSMVEILAVLAIIGLLSIGGVAGYSLAVIRHRANALLNTAGQLSSMSVGGRTYASLADAGLKAGETGVDMSSNEAGEIIITGLAQDSRFYSVFKTVSVGNIVGSPECVAKKCTLILSFKKED